MSSWFYVGLAFGITYVVLGAYTLYLMRRRARARHALQAELQRVEA
jgi:hypothetical protein